MASIVSISITCFPTMGRDLLVTLRVRRAPAARPSSAERCTRLCFSTRNSVVNFVTSIALSCLAPKEKCWKRQHQLRVTLQTWTPCLEAQTNFQLMSLRPAELALCKHDICSQCSSQCSRNEKNPAVVLYHGLPRNT
jgi:hypothetical protein